VLLQIRQVIKEVETALLSSSSEQDVFFATTRNYMSNFFLISHRSGDIRLLVATFRLHQQIAIHSLKNFVEKFEKSSANVTHNLSLSVRPKMKRFSILEALPLGIKTLYMTHVSSATAVSADLSCELS